WSGSPGPMGTASAGGCGTSSSGSRPTGVPPARTAPAASIVPASADATTPAIAAAERLNGEGDKATLPTQQNAVSECLQVMVKEALCLLRFLPFHRALTMPLRLKLSVRRP